jgi:hypothetical protein
MGKLKLPWEEVGVTKADTNINNTSNINKVTAVNKLRTLTQDIIK